MKPSVGRIVHHIDTGRDEECHAAIVIAADEDHVDLVVFESPASERLVGGGPFPGPVSWYLDVKPAREVEAGWSDGWHWPERVE